MPESGRNEPVVQQLLNSTLSAGNDLNLYNVAGSLTVNKETSSLNRLKTMLNPVSSAGHDSYEAQRRSECFPNTRVKVLEAIEAWINAEGPETPVYVLDGVAGIGKSTIAQTIAVRAADLGILGASFFFSRDEELRQIAKHFFPTVAFQLACFDSTFAQRISTSLEQNPDAPEKRLQQQVKLLLLEPLQDLLSQRVKPLLIVIDAIDECEEDGAQELLSLLGDHAHHIPSLKILITTRPEWHIRQVLNEDKGIHKTFRLHEIEHDVVHADIRLYLSSSLSLERVQKIYKSRRNPWQPSSSELEMLCGICGTLFIIATTATKFILDPKRANPQKQISRLLDGVSVTSYTGSKHTNVLDETYIRILCAAFGETSEDDDDWFAAYNQVMGALVTLANPLPCYALAEILDMDPDDIEASLAPLHSLVAPTGISADTIFRIHHKSFPDFITNRQRILQALGSWTMAKRSDLDQLLWVDIEYHHLQLAKACFRVMDRELKQNMAGLDEADWYRDKAELPHVGPHLIPLSLKYASLHWAHHLLLAHRLDEDEELQVYLDGWTFKHILSWFEVMTILDQISATFGILQDAIDCLNVDRSGTSLGWAEQSKTQELLADAYRFVQRSSTLMKLSTMNIYRTCLVLVPTSTMFYRTYEGWATMELCRGGEKNWDPLLATLASHSGFVLAVTFSSDGTQLASASADCTICLWDVRTGSHISTLVGHSELVRSVAFTPDGSRLASASDDMTVRLWNAKTGSLLSTLTGHSNTVMNALFLRDGLWVASVSDDNTIRLWDGEKGTHICTLVPESIPPWPSERGNDFRRKHPDLFDSTSMLACSPDGLYLASTYDYFLGHLWDTEKRAHICTLDGHSSHITSLSFSPNGSQLATASFDKTVRLWNGKTGAHIFTLRGHTAPVYSVVFSRDNRQLISGSGDGTIRLWDVRTGLSTSTLTNQSCSVVSVTTSTDGKWIASASNDSMLRIWNALTGTLVSVLAGHGSYLICVAFSSDSLRLASGSWDDTARLWSIQPDTSHTLQADHSIQVCTIAFSDDGSHLALGSVDGIVQLWNIKTDLHVFSTTSTTDPTLCVLSIAFSTDGARIISAHGDFIIRMRCVKTGDIIHTLNGHSSFVYDIALSSNGALLASASGDHTIRLWKAKTGAHICTLTGHTSPVCFVAFSSDGLVLASASSDDTVRLWDGQSGRHMTTLTGHMHAVNRLCFRRSSYQLVSISIPGRELRLWDGMSGTFLSAFRVDGWIVRSAAFIDGLAAFVFPSENVSGPPIASLLLVVAREEANYGDKSKLTGLVVVTLCPPGNWEIHPMCWFPPHIQAESAVINQVDGTVAIIGRPGRLLLLKFPVPDIKHVS